MRPGRFTLIELLVVLAILAILIGLLDGGLWGAGLALVAGWVLYPIRVLPQVRPDPWSLLTGVLCLAGLIVGLQVLLSRWARQAHQGRGTDPAPPWRLSWTLRLVALVVVMFIAGISAVGMGHQLGWLVSSPGSWAERDGWQQVGGRMYSANNLKQIGVALHGHVEQQGALPPGGTFDANGNAMHGWLTFMLPYVEQEPLFKQVKLEKPWHHAENGAPFGTVVKTYLSPGVPTPEGEAYAPSHYAGNARLLGPTPFKFDQITDGTANTLLAGEVNARFKPWGHPTNWRDPALGINRSPDGFGSPWKGGAYLMMADGSVRFVTNAASTDVLRAASTPAGGETDHDLSTP